MDKQTFVSHRKQFLAALPNHSVAVLSSAPELLRNGDTHHLYRQSSDFYYLTGCHEPHSIAVFIKENNAQRFILFVRECNPDAERWDGQRLGPEGAKQILGADEAYPLDQWIDKLPELLHHQKSVWLSFSQNREFKIQMIDIVGQIKRQKRSQWHLPDCIENSDTLLHELRLFKDEFELQAIKQATQISAQAHLDVMKQAKQCRYEYELEAIFLQTIYRQGCRAVAYPGIFASGPNSCTLHYVQNDRAINDNDLVLVDAGGEYQYYAADITRTFPASGKFSSKQRAIYEIVLHAQKAAIDLAKPGLEWPRLQQTVIEVLTRGLLELGLLQGQLDDLIHNKAYQRFYMHGSGHWLGLDVHDVGSYQVDDEPRKLKAGMVFTIEPGLYLNAGSDLDSKWHHIGVRIEDDILVTEQGCEVLTRLAPKEINDIEAAMK